MATIPYTETSATTLSGSINGSNTDFTVTNTPDDYSVIGFINGLFIPTTVSGKVVTFAGAPISGDTVSVHYYVSSAVSSSTGAVTASTIIQDAMRRINVLGAGQTISTADQTFGLVELNDMIDQWRVRKSYVVYYTHNSYAFTTSKQYYSIGRDSADFDADRPVKILRANLIRVADDPDSRIPLHVMELDEYASIPLPMTEGAEPDRLYYQETYPNGTLWPWPYPTDTAAALANELELFTWSYLESFATSDTSVDLAPGYKDAITWSLAERFCIPYGVDTSIALVRQARRARAAVVNVNIHADNRGSSDYGVPNSEAYG
jgi:hypothetical protein